MASDGYVAAYCWCCCCGCNFVLQPSISRIIIICSADDIASPLLRSRLRTRFFARSDAGRRRIPWRASHPPLGVRCNSFFRTETSAVSAKSSAYGVWPECPLSCPHNEKTTLINQENPTGASGAPATSQRPTPRAEPHEMRAQILCRQDTFIINKYYIFFSD